VSKTYQEDRRAGQSAAPPAEVAVPGQVAVPAAGIAGLAKEGLLALAVSAGLQVMTAMSGEDVARLRGPGGKHDPGHAGYRHGTESGSVTVGGRRVPVTRPAGAGRGRLRGAAPAQL
jgi:putative transposase